MLTFRFLVRLRLHIVMVVILSGTRNHLRIVNSDANDWNDGL